MESYREMNNDRKIKYIWELLHPWEKEFNLDSRTACLEIKRTLNAMCKKEFTAAFLILYRAVFSEHVSEKDNFRTLCNKLKNEVDNLCPTNSLCESLKNKFIINFRLPQSLELYPVSLFFYNIPIPKIAFQIPDNEQFKPFGTNGLFQKEVEDFAKAEKLPEANFNTYLSMYNNYPNEREFRKYIQFELPYNLEYGFSGYETDKTTAHNEVRRRFNESFYNNWLLFVGDKPEVPRLTDAEVELIIYLHNAFKSGKLSLFTPWDKLCAFMKNN